MEKKPGRDRLIYPYLILAIALVCTGLILSDLWATVDSQVPFPWEGPSPTPTLWWRTPQAETPTGTPTPPASSGLSAPPAASFRATPSPAAASPAAGSPAAGAPLAGSLPEASGG